MIHLGRLSLAGTGIVMGGLLLGTGLASFASPVPKAPEPAPWEGQLHPQYAAGDGYYQSMPQDLYPASLPSSYAPAIAFTELRWSSDFKTPKFEEYPVATPLPRFDDSALRDGQQLTQAAETPVNAPHYAAIEQAAQAAQIAATESTSAQDSTDAAELTVQIDPAAPPPLPANEGGPKIIQVANAG